MYTKTQTRDNIRIMRIRDMSEDLDLSDMEVNDVITSLLGLAEIYYALGNFAECHRIVQLAERWQRYNYTR